MTWAELDMAAKVWTLPAARAKNGRQHSIPLSEQAFDVLRLVCPESGLTNSHDLVFQPVSFSREKAKLDAELQSVGISLQPWTLHDLRRTAASGMPGLAPRRM